MKKTDSNTGVAKKKIDVRTYGMLMVMVVVWIVFQVMTDGAYFSARNLSNLIRAMSPAAILGCGAVLVIITDNIDLSVGTYVGASGTIAAALIVWEDVSTLWVILIILALGILVGTLHGLSIVYLRVPAFIVTLGTQMVFKGVTLGLGKGMTIAPLHENFIYLAQGYLSTILTVILAVAFAVILVFQLFRKRMRYKKLGLGELSMGKELTKIIFIIAATGFLVWYLSTYKNLPIPVLVVIVILIIATFIAEKTVLGRAIYAVGGNKKAALFSGINVKKTIISVFIINGLFASVAGLLVTARLNAGAPTAGLFMELDAIAAAVIGGASFSGGRGRVLGAILGTLVMTSLDNGINLLGLMPFWQYIIKGLILVLAVWLDTFKSKER